MLNITGQNFIAGQRSSAGSKFVLATMLQQMKHYPISLLRPLLKKLIRQLKQLHWLILLLDKLRQNNALFF